jgi:putative toxin-antitoxin system antitoxin component (TIGR02293 family)
VSNKGFISYSHSDKELKRYRGKHESIFSQKQRQDLIIEIVNSVNESEPVFYGAYGDFILWYARDVDGKIAALIHTPIADGSFDRQIESIREIAESATPQADVIEFWESGSTDNEKVQPTLKQEERTRVNLLDLATSGGSLRYDPLQTLEDTTRVETVAVLGGESVLGRAITNDQELLDALIQGFPADVLSALREAGISHSVFEQVVAPRRTLMRRKAEGQRLTRAESDAVWRLANIFALATRVLNGRKAAIDWLTRAKPTFANRTPIDLLETSVGAAYVNRMLQRLEWGDVA